MLILRETCAPSEFLFSQVIFMGKVMNSKSTMIISCSTFLIPVLFVLFIFRYSIVPQTGFETGFIIGCITLLVILSLLLITVSFIKSTGAVRGIRKQANTNPRDRSQRSDRDVIALDTKGILAVSEPGYEEFIRLTNREF